MQSSMKAAFALTRCFRCSTRFVKLAPRVTPLWQTRTLSSSAIPAPSFEGEDKKYPEKIHKLVGDISQLTLLEIADLNDLLKKTLNITDAPMMQMAGSAAPVKEEEAEAEEAPKVKSTFTVRIVSYEKDKKTTLIKEIRNYMEGMNLAQARAFIEGVPSVVRTEASKEEAEKLKTALSAIGATIEVE